MKHFNSPKVLVDAAGSPVQELPPVGMRPDKPHVARPWGYKGTMIKPDGWDTKQPRPVITPDHWKWLSLLKKADGYTLLSFATQGALLKADLRILRIPTATKAYALQHKEALGLGERIEAAFARLAAAWPQPKRDRQQNST